MRTDRDWSVIKGGKKESQKSKGRDHDSHYMDKT